MGLPSSTRLKDDSSASGSTYLVHVSRLFPRSAAAHSAIRPSVCQRLPRTNLFLIWEGRKVVVMAKGRSEVKNRGSDRPPLLPNVLRLMLGLNHRLKFEDLRWLSLTINRVVVNEDHRLEAPARINLAGFSS